jgi:hypothetical protein
MTDRLDQLNAGIEKMFPFCHAVLYAIVGTFFRASAMVTNDGPKPCSFGAPKNSQENPGSSCDRTDCQIVSSNTSTTLSIIAARLEQLIDQPCKTMSIARCDWAAADHSI